MSSYQFIISSGPEDPTRATRSIMFASRCLEQGHEVIAFLMDDAVQLSNLALAANVQAATGDTLMQYLQPFMDNGGRVIVCLPCAKARGVGEDSLPGGWVLGKGVDVIRRNEEGWNTWTF